jgi:hypothetical protein
MATMNDTGNAASLNEGMRLLITSPCLCFVKLIDFDVRAVAAALRLAANDFLSARHHLNKSALFAYPVSYVEQFGRT